MFRYSLKASNLASLGLCLYSFQRFCFLFIEFSIPAVVHGAMGVDLLERLGWGVRQWWINFQGTPSKF